MCLRGLLVATEECTIRGYTEKKDGEVKMSGVLSIQIA